MQKIKPSWLIAWVIFFFQFELFGIGPVTMIRVVILPLFLYYLLREKKMRVIKSSPFIFCLFFCLVEMIAGILNNNIAFLIAGIMNFLTIVVFVDYLVKSDGFSSADWFAFTTYDWACILYFIFTYEGLNLSNRFKGIYWDPNVMCVYIIIALTAKIILLNEGRLSARIKIMYQIFILMDVLLIFSSISRAGMLAFGTVVLIWTYVKSKKIFLLFVTSLCVLMGYMYNLSQKIVWSMDLSPIEVLSYRIFVSSELEMEDPVDGSRSDRMQRFWDVVEQGDLFIIGNGTNYLPDGGYVHNGVLEFFLTVGIPLGGIFILVFVYLIGKGFINSFCGNRRLLIYSFILSYFLVTVFYSYLSFKSFWVFIAYLIYLNYKNGDMKIRRALTA